jgi:hypothetical protein
MKTLARLLAGAALLCLFPLHMHAQNTTVTASALKMKLLPIPTGLVTFTPVDASSRAVPFQSSGLNSPQAFACSIANGALSGCSVPDLCIATPANLKYQISISTSGYQYTLFQVANVCGTSWPLDAYVPPATTSSYAPISAGYGTAVPSGACPNAAEYVRNGNGGELYICVAAAWVKVTGGGGGGSVTFPSGVLAGANSTSAPTAATSNQMQTAIGAGVYDASGAAAAATATAAQKANNLSDLANAATARSNLGLAHINESTPGVETVTQPIVVNDGTGSGLITDTPEADCSIVPLTPGHDYFCADSVTHTTLYSKNGGAFVSIPTSGGGSGAWTNITGSVTVANCTVVSGKCTVGSATPTVTFSSIPSTYNSLQISCTYNSSNLGANGLFIQFNGDTAAHYVSQLVYGVGSAAGALGSGLVAAASFLTYPGSSGGSTPGVASINIPNYSGTTWNKQAFATTSRWASSSQAVYQDASLLWFSTAAINSISFGDLGGANIVAGSVCSLYGVQ